MPYTEEQLDSDLEYMAQLPEWQDASKRRDLIRANVKAIRETADDETQQKLIPALWKHADGGWVKKAGRWLKEAGEDVAKSAVASGGAAAFAVSDAAGWTDTGSKTRVEQGLVNTAGSAVQLGKRVMPGESEQSKRDQMLEALREDIEAGALPDEFEGWLAGDYDGKELPAEVKPFVDRLIFDYGKQAQMANYGKVDKEKLRTWLESDRNPMRADSDTPGVPGPRLLLADYVVTRDPASWEAFQRRVAETDQEYQTRVRTWAAEQRGGATATLESMEEGLTKDMVKRSFGMQGSPIDMATALLPLLRGTKALKAARAGGMGAAVVAAGKGAVKEGVQEGATEALSDPQATWGSVADAAGKGAAGSAMLEGGMGTAGAVAKKLMQPESVEGGQSALPDDEETRTLTDVPAGAKLEYDAEGNLVGWTMPDLAADPAGRTVGLEEDLGDLTAEEVADLEAVPDETAPDSGIDREEGLMESEGYEDASPAAEIDDAIGAVESGAAEAATGEQREDPEGAGARGAGAALSRFAEGQGLVRDVKALENFEGLPGGGEHDLYFDGATGSLYKVTMPAVQLRSGRDVTGQRTVGGYLQRWRLANEAFAAGMKLAGVIDDPKGIRLVMRQPMVLAADVENPHPDKTEINPWLRAAGFEYQSGAWVRQEDGLVVSDDHVGNFVKTETGLRAVDLQVSRLSGAKGSVIPWEVTLERLREAGLEKPAPAPEAGAEAGGGFRVPERGAKRNLEAGFVNGEIVGELLDAAVAAIRSGLTNFATWAGEMVRKFGEGVRRYLRGVWANAVRMSEVGAVGDLRGMGKPAKGPVPRMASAGQKETQARFARPEAEERLHETREDTQVRLTAEGWLEVVSLDEAVSAFEAGPNALPAAMTGDVAQRAAGLILQRATVGMRTGTELQQLEARSLAHRMSKVWQGWLSQEAGRNLRQRAVVNAELAPHAPILAAEGVLIDRADAVMDRRFEGGAEAAGQKVRQVAEDAGAAAGEEVVKKLNGEGAAPTPEEVKARAERTAAQRTAERILEQLAQRHSDTPPAERPRKVDPVRALYQAHLAKPMSVEEFVAAAVGLEVPAELAGRLHAMAAIEQAKASEAAQAAKARLLAKDSPSLAKLLNRLRAKMFPGMSWAEIFMQLPSQQKERQREIYRRLRLDERLRGLNAEERLALANELDKAWQRERRKVFQRELRKAGVLGEKAESDRNKVAAAMPKLLRMINLGLFNSAMFREAVAPEFGLRMISAADATRLRTLAEEAYDLPEGVLRNRKLAELLNGIQRATGGSRAEMLNQYWVAAVLSGLRTQFDTFMSVVNGLGTTFIQAGMLALRNGNRAAALQSLAQWWAGLLEALPEALQILSRGDYSYLKRFNVDLQRALDGEGTFRPVPLGESLWREGNWWQKYGLAPVMMWTGRLMAAADHINNTATTAGAMAVARALHPEIYGKAGGWTVAEAQAAYKQALREVTGGAKPANAKEAATVRARTREIKAGNLRPDEQKEASFIGDQAAYQNDPVGVFGAIYRAFSGGLGLLESGTQAAAERIGSDGPARAYAQAFLLFVGGAIRSVTGTKFIRFGANFGNDTLGYLPGTALVWPAVAGFEATRSQKQLLLGKNIIGLMMGVTVAAYFVGKGDDEEGWHIEGGWSDLSDEEKKQRKTAGFEQFSFWRRAKDGTMHRMHYRQWPAAGLLAAVAQMQDRQRFSPDKWRSEGVSGHLLAAATMGAFQVRNVAALEKVAKLIGASSFASNPEDKMLEEWGKLPRDFAGAFVPNLAKDADALLDPRRYKPEMVLEEWMRHVPVVRRGVAEGRPEINILGLPVLNDRSPWSRAYTNVEQSAAHRVLGAMTARGISLPAPSTKKLVYVNGAKVPIESLGGESEWRYQKAVGDRYREWLATEGGQLMRLNNEEVQRVVNRQAEMFKQQAAWSLFGGG